MNQKRFLNILVIVVIVVVASIIGYFLMWRVPSPLSIPKHNSSISTDSSPNQPTISNTTSPDTLCLFSDNSKWVKADKVKRQNDLPNFVLGGFIDTVHCKAVVIGTEALPLPDTNSLIGKPLTGSRSGYGIVPVIASFDNKAGIFRIKAVFPSTYSFFKIIFSDQNTGWASGLNESNVQVNRLLFVTHNGGEDWQPIEFPYGTLLSTDLITSGSAEAMLFTVSNDGTVWTVIDQKHSASETTKPGIVVKSSDRGKAWQKIYYEQDGEWISAIRVMGSKVVLGGSRNGAPLILVSDDGGQTFQKSSLPIQFNSVLSISMPDQGHIFLTGRKDSQNHDTIPPEGFLLKSNDGGKKWTSVLTNPQLAFSSDGPTFTTVNNGYANIFVTSDEPVFTTTHDAGVTWEAQPYEYFAPFPILKRVSTSNNFIYYWIDNF